MADSSESPETLPADEARNPGEGISEAPGSTLQDTKEEEVRKEKTAFVASEPMREELLQSALTFLKHPKVVTASDVQRRSFLEKKGLTMDEIDEAFRRLLNRPSSCAIPDTFTNQGVSDHSCGVPQMSLLSVGRLEPETEPVEPLMPHHPKSYMEIMEMIQRGERPDDIQDINDNPPNPNQPLSESRMAPRPKPWDKQGRQNTSWDLKPLSSNSTELRSEVQNDNSDLATGSTNRSNQGDLLPQAEVGVVSDETPKTDAAASWK